MIRPRTKAVREVKPRFRKDGLIWGARKEATVGRRDASVGEFLGNYWRHEFKDPGPARNQDVRVTNLCSARGPHGLPCLGVYDDARHF